MARCTITLVGDAPCQCFTSGAVWMVSPAPNSATFPAPLLHAAGAGDDVKDLPPRMRVPRRARARLEAHAHEADRAFPRELHQLVAPRHATHPFRRQALWRAGFGGHGFHAGKTLAQATEGAVIPPPEFRGRPRLRFRFVGMASPASPALPRPVPGKPPRSRLVAWLLAGQPVKGTEGAHAKPEHTHDHSWWRVMCLTGVDYFSTLGYQPSIAALAAGALSPFATLVLVLLTLFGALPVYARVAAESPHGEGSVAMLERLLSWWKGKLFVLTLLGFAATDFIITITLSAADAAAHLIENPFAPAFLHGQALAVTLVFVALLGAVFLRGFKEAVGIAVVLVAGYLLLNAVVISAGLAKIFSHPHVFVDWKNALFTSHGNPLVMLGVCLLLFPKLALGLSGFETGVAVMPLVRGAPGDTEENPVGRVRHTRRLLLTAALLMSAFLLTSSLVTTLLIPSDAFRATGSKRRAARPGQRPRIGLSSASVLRRRLRNGL